MERFKLNLSAEEILQGVFDSHKTDATDDYIRLLAPTIVQKRLFKSQRGFMGMGLETVLPGNEIWMLFGAQSPMVLRRTSNEDEFTLRGDCYVHGFMHGEAFDDKWGVKDNIRRIKIV
jgi:hypothetical protein